MQRRRSVPGRDSRTALHSCSVSAISVLILAVALCGCRARSVPVGPPALIFRTVPIGLCEDYPEESRSMDEVRRDVAVPRGVRGLKAPVLDGWGGGAPDHGDYQRAFLGGFGGLAGPQKGHRPRPGRAHTPPR